MAAPLLTAHTVIRASAGAGKTYELTNRYIALLHQGHPASGILATTFTRKAAGEILGRLLSRLADAAQHDSAATVLANELGDPKLTSKRCQQLLAEVCHALHTVSICTLDSFFARMARCFHHELDVPLEARTIGEDDAAAVQLRAAAIDAMLADADLSVLMDMMQRLYHDSAGRSVTDFIDQQVKQLYDVYRRAPQAEAWSTLVVPPRLDTDAFDAAVAELHRLQADGTSAWSKRMVGGLAKAIEVIEQRDWQAFLSKGLGLAIVDGSMTYYSKPIPDELVASLEPLLACADAELIGEVARRTKVLHDLLERFDVHYTRLRRDHRVLLFSDLPHKLANELPLHGADALAEVYYRLDTRVAHLLLDEFQDTSNEQWQILRPFAQEIAAHGDGSRSFFCVGDTKQAIYGWRDGCAELFDQLQDQLHLPPEAMHFRHTSYRSSQIVLDAVNQVFAEIDQSPCLAQHATVAGKWQQRFEPHMAYFPHPGYVELITSTAADVASEDSPTQDDDSDPSADDLHREHLAFTAERIAQLAHDAPERTIGVLVSRNKTVIQLLENLQQEHGLSVSGEGGSPVTDDPAVDAVLAALTLADHPGHSAAAYHVLNSPLGHIVGLQRTAEAHVADVALNIRTALLARGYGAVISAWAQQLACDCKRRSVIRLTQLIELADRFDPDLTLRPGDFVRFAQHTHVEEPTPAAIRVMTVHKSKGLEFDLVVLPDLNRQLGRLMDTAVYVERDNPTAPISAVYAGTNQFVRARCPQLQRAYDQELARRLNDDLSVLYVAMTRARHAVHMIVPPLQTNKNGKLKSIGLCYAAILRAALGRDDEQVGLQQSLYQHGDPAWARPQGPPADKPVVDDTLPDVPVLLAESPAGSRRSWPRLTPSTAHRGEHIAASDLLDLAPPQAAVRGEVLHAWFEQVAWPNDPLPADEALLAIGRSIAPHAAADWLGDQLDTFKQMLEMPTVRAALELPAAGQADRIDLWRERPFAVRFDGHLVSGRFDRVVLVSDTDGQVLRAQLLDFKTDRVEPESLDRLVQRYAPQVKLYRRALGLMLKLEAESISTSLLFLETGACIDTRGHHEQA